jgi:uncharacterized membrane protein YfhO
MKKSKISLLTRFLTSCIVYFENRFSNNFIRGRLSAHRIVNPSRAERQSNSQIVTSIQEETAEKIAILVKAPQKGFLVLLDTLTEGWKATVDGESVEIFQTNGIFRSVSVPDGNHQVVFTYTTPGWNTGRITSLVGIVLCFLVLIIESLYTAKDKT